MSSITEQLSAATKTQLESQLNILNNIANTTFDGAQQVIALNLSATKASVEGTAAAAKQLLEAKDANDLLSLVQAPGLDRVFAYGRELFAIVSKTQAGLLQVAKDQFQDASAAVNAAVPRLSEAASAPVAQTVQAVQAAVQAAAPVVTAEPLAVAAQPKDEDAEDSAPAAAKNVAKAKSAVAKAVTEAFPEEAEHKEESSVSAPSAPFPEVKPAVNLKSVSTKPKK